MNTNKQTSRWALVTGASSGIGAAFARELAARGVSLVLTARRRDRLHLLAEELQALPGISVITLAHDLSHPDTPKALCAELEQRGIGIDILINNAGYGVPGNFETPSWQTHADFIQVLMTAPTELCYRLLPNMQHRGFGRIVNIASLAGHLPGSAGHTLYSASKAYLIKFSQSLALENRNRDIHVCAVCPGFTYSEFHDVTGARALVSKMPKWMWLRAESVAAQGMDAVERGAVMYVTGRINRAIKCLFQHLPDNLALRLIARRSKDFRVTDSN